MRDFWGRKTVCLVTGAGQNIGRAFAECVASKLGPDSLLILASRWSTDKLGVVRQSAYEHNPTGLRVELVQWDPAKPDGPKYLMDLETILNANHDRIMGEEEQQEEEFELAMIVHNAGVAEGHGLTEPSQLIDLIDADLIRHYFDIDLVGVLVANSAFWSVFGGRKSREKVLIDITSTADDSGSGSGDSGLNSISKSSRKLALNTLADENPDIRVAHFASGRVQVDPLMRRLSEGGDQATTTTKMLRKIQQEYHEHNKIEQPAELVRALLEFLGENELEPCMEIDARRLLLMQQNQPTGFHGQDVVQGKMIKEKF